MHIRSGLVHRRDLALHHRRWRQIAKPDESHPVLPGQHVANDFGHPVRSDHPRRLRSQLRIDGLEILLQRLLLSERSRGRIRGIHCLDCVGGRGHRALQGRQLFLERLAA